MELRYARNSPFPHLILTSPSPSCKQQFVEVAIVRRLEERFALLFALAVPCVSYLFNRGSNQLASRFIAAWYVKDSALAATIFISGNL